jgi:hypothetical protein
MTRALDENPDHRGPGKVAIKMAIIFGQPMALRKLLCKGQREAFDPTRLTIDDYARYAEVAKEWYEYFWLKCDKIRKAGELVCDLRLVVGVSGFVLVNRDVVYPIQQAEGGFCIAGNGFTLSAEQRTLLYSLFVNPSLDQPRVCELSTLLKFAKQRLLSVMPEFDNRWEVLQLIFSYIQMERHPSPPPVYEEVERVKEHYSPPTQEAQPLTPPTLVLGATVDVRPATKDSAHSIGAL